MTVLVQHLIDSQATERPDATALVFNGEPTSYARLRQQVDAVAAGLLSLGLAAGDRVAVYLPKRPETVAALFGTAAAGGIFIPANPLLKPRQLIHLLYDSGARILITTTERLAGVERLSDSCPALERIVLIDDGPLPDAQLPPTIRWPAWLDAADRSARPQRRIDIDPAAILYTSGSTGRPKGVVLSHRNLVSGAESVSGYLRNRADDRLLAVLPLSFDYGLSQLTTAFRVGAAVVLMEYLLPRDVIEQVARERITGLAAVPPLWNRLADLEWPDAARASLRYITNTGGALPPATTRRLRQRLPDTDIVLMYGLTEAFRSTWLPPDQLDRRPDSIGKAIPNAEILVVREDGSECAPDEPGELVHRGALVALGYWNDPERTARIFRPAPGRDKRLPMAEIAVWSGDRVRRDADGYLYFLGRGDQMIKSSGYRISPQEIEEVIAESGHAANVVVIGAPHPLLGQGIVAVVEGEPGSEQAILAHCRRELPGFMVPLAIHFMERLPTTPNGKLDRDGLAERFADRFSDSDAAGARA